jgi:thioredoxin 1
MRASTTSRGRSTTPDHADSIVQSCMEPTPRNAIGLTVIGAVIVGAVALRTRPAAVPEVPAGSAPSARSSGPRPRLLELGSTSCKSCLDMHAELAHLRRECGGVVDIDEVDVFVDEATAERYGVQVIPAQIFFGADGRESDRHIGFLPRGEVRDRFAKHGVRCP